MSEKLCALRKIGGGTLKETVLWTNPSPSSSYTGAVVTLSDDITKYDYIKVEWAETKSALTKKVSALVSVSDFVTTFNPNTAQHVVYLALGGKGTSYLYSRCFTYKTNTSAEITNAYAANTTSVDNQYSIPLNIYGVK